MENPAQEPVTVVVRRTVKPGAGPSYEACVSRLVEQAAALPGYLGTQVQRPSPPSRTYLSTFRFASTDTLAAFEQSEVRAQFLREVVPHVETDAVWEKMTGLELWFTPPPGSLVPQPSRFRMSLLLIAVVFGLVLSIGWGVGLVLHDWPYPARLLVTITVEVFLMTYVVMPRLTRRLAGWLYP